MLSFLLHIQWVSIYQLAFGFVLAPLIMIPGIATDSVKKKFNDYKLFSFFKRDRVVSVLSLRLFPKGNVNG